MKTILLLEDDESLNRGISLKLSKEGYQVLSAYTMREAKSMFEQEAIDLVISDITLPDGNGLDFGRAVREKSDVHLIYLTAMDQEIDIVNGYDTGADDYITKPFSVNILVSKVNAFMRRIHETGKEILLSEGSNAKEMAKEGAGVGLYLARSIIEQQGGSILAKRKPGFGMIFKIMLPI